MAESYQFRRHSRLTTANEFQAVFNSNFKISDTFMTLLISSQRSDQPKLGFAIAKKQIKSAVDRNRLKRVFRESFRHQKAKLPNKQIVILVRHRIQFQTNLQIFNLMQDHWKRVISECEKS